MKELKDLTLQEYEGLKKSGFLWEFYPEATGDVDEDLEAVFVSLQACGRYFYDIRDEEAEYDW